MGKKKSACQTAPGDGSGVKSSPGVQFQTATKHNSTPRITFWTKEATLKPSSGMRFYAHFTLCYGRLLSQPILFTHNSSPFKPLTFFHKLSCVCNIAPLRKDTCIIKTGFKCYPCRDTQRLSQVSVSAIVLI